MIKISSVSELPTVAAVYAMFGGRGRSLYVAYVGIAGNLRNRITQHLILRDSSISTGVSAVHLNPNYVTEVHFWTKPEFSNSQTREAAELICFDILNPALRSRGAVTERAKQLYKDNVFREQMIALFSSDPTGAFIIPTLQDALNRIANLEEQVEQLKRNR